MSIFWKRRSWKVSKKIIAKNQNCTVVTVLWNWIIEKLEKESDPTSYSLIFDNDILLNFPHGSFITVHYSCTVERILSATLMTWLTPDHGLCESPTYLNRSSSPCISFMSANRERNYFICKHIHINNGTIEVDNTLPEEIKTPTNAARLQTLRRATRNRKLGGQCLIIIPHATTDNNGLLN